MNDKEEILGVYSRYCRLFITDNEMINKYFKEIITQQRNESSGNGIEYFGSVIEISKDFFNQQITTPNPSIAFTEFLRNTFIASNLNICNSTNRNCFTHLWSLKNNDIEIRYLNLSFQDLTLNEIILINQKCKLISVKFTKVNIFESDYNGSFCAIEDVIACFSTLKYLELNCETLVYTEATATKLTNLPENTKFSRFAIFWVTNGFDLNAFCIFLKVIFFRPK
uniref:LRR containing protein n=1 Tax=Panagrolaimus sp. PS1159 TaxID=55785 RepID=A0AC35FEX2_9BILA